ncbi:energy transducer TonB [Rhodocaloribacter sp.]
MASRSEQHPLSLPERFARRREVYRVRILASMAASLLVVLAAVRLPVPQSPVKVGWVLPSEDERTIQLEDVREEAKPEQASGVPITFFADPETVERTEGVDRDAVEEAPPEEHAPPLPDVPMERMVLAFAEKMPTIQGGLGAYYINIEYPQAAIAAGIQGRLILDFVVEPDGRPTSIKVLKPLHPLCDSAAVRALRKTRFMPGRQNGEVVPVRMRLPVSFRLIDQSALDSTATATDSVGAVPDSSRAARRDGMF